MPALSRRAALPLVLALVAVTVFAASSRPAAGQGDDDEPYPGGLLTLLHSDDTQSALLAGTITIDGMGTSLPVGGVAAFKTLTEQQIAEARAAGASVLNLFAGNAYYPGAVAICSRGPGSPIYDALAQAAIPFDAHAIAQRDFDYGPGFFEQFVRAYPGQPFLSSNLDFSAEPGFDDLVDEDGLIETLDDGRVIGRSMVITDAETGVQFGLVAAITSSIPITTSPRNVAVTPDLASTAAAVQSEIDRLYDDIGVRRIILMSHLQTLDLDLALVALLSRVDVAVAGGANDLLQNPEIAPELQRLPGETLETAGTYPLEAAGADGRTVYVVTTTGGYRYLGRIDIGFDEDGEVIDVVADQSYPRPVVPESDAATALGFPGAVPEDEGLLTSVVAPLEECLAGLATEPVASTEVLLDVSSVNRVAETNTGNLITDAFLHRYDQLAESAGLAPRSAENPVIALQNGGGIQQTAGDVLPRGGVVPGEIFRIDTLDVTPFSNFLAVVPDVTPADLKATLERAAVQAVAPGTDVDLESIAGQFLQVAGLRVVYDATQPEGSRVVSVTLDDGRAIIADGAVVEGAPDVTVITISFLARGGDGFAVLASLPNQVQLPGTDEEAWHDYLAELGTIGADDARYQPGGEGRITFAAQEPEPEPSATPEPSTPAATPTPAPASPTATLPAPAPPDAGGGLTGDPRGLNPMLLAGLLLLGFGAGWFALRVRGRQ